MGSAVGRSRAHPPRAWITRQYSRPLPTCRSSAQPAQQVCLAQSQWGPVPNSLTGRKDVNRGQGVGGGGQRRPASSVGVPCSPEAAHRRGLGTCPLSGRKQ